LLKPLYMWILCLSLRCYDFVTWLLLQDVLSYTKGWIWGSSAPGLLTRTGVRSCAGGPFDTLCVLVQTQAIICCCPRRYCRLPL
ncbi:hypothetical protein GOODEAATRI_019656, partial [Goodea atripinnis]